MKREKENEETENYLLAPSSPLTTALPPFDHRNGHFYSPSPSASLSSPFIFTPLASMPHIQWDFSASNLFSTRIISLSSSPLPLSLASSFSSFSRFFFRKVLPYVSRILFSVYVAMFFFLMTCCSVIIRKIQRQRI